MIEENGEVLGFAVGDKRDGNIWALFVHPSHERRGYGRQLHDAMVAWLRSQGWRRAGQTRQGELRFELPSPGP